MGIIDDELPQCFRDLSFVFDYRCCRCWDNSSTGLGKRKTPRLPLKLSRLLIRYPNHESTSGAGHERRQALEDKTVEHTGTDRAREVAGNRY